jgi:hypothetical protein
MAKENVTTTGIGSLHIAGTDNKEEFLEIDAGDNGDLGDLTNYGEVDLNKQPYYQQQDEND